MNNTIITLCSGSSTAFRTMATLANAKINFTTSHNGFDELYHASSLDNADSDDEEPSKPRPEGYLEPFARDKHNEMLGFILDSETAVMLIPTFGEKHVAVIAEKATEIVTRARASGRKKLIIDLTSNPGGSDNRYWDLFRLLFPNLFPYDALRFRVSDSTSLLAKFLGSSPPNTTDVQEQLRYQQLVRPGPGGREFTSVNELLSNEEVLGMKVSALHTVNLTTRSTDESPIRGYGAAAGELNAILGYKPEDVLVVGDGACASSGTAFTDMLMKIAGVHSVVFGGRPQSAPMQPMGGVRGGEIVALTNIAQAAVLATSGNNTLLTWGEKQLAHMTLPGLDPSIRLAGSVNFQNQDHEGNDQLPLQFDYQAADCRLFYTAENVHKPGTVWHAAKKAVWGGGVCVQGFMGNKKGTCLG